MITSIKSTELKIGMFIELPRAWRSHPFLRNSFTIKSQDQIKKIIEYGIAEVNINVDKGIAKQEMLPEVQEQEKAFPSQIVPDELPEKDSSFKITLDELIALTSDQKMSPELKSQAVHWHTVSMMNKLFENPTGENITTVKKGIANVVDLILADDATNHHLLRISSYKTNNSVHSANVGVLATSLAKQIFKKEDKHDMHALGAGFFLHDLGKVSIDEAIFNKPGKLTADEMKTVQKHPAMGFNLLYETKQICTENKLIVLQHHERANGTGYPKGLRGDDIHIYGKICSVADVYDALVSKRPYRQQLKPFEALKVMKEEMLDHFQKEILEKFILMLIS